VRIYSKYHLKEGLPKEGDVFYRENKQQIKVLPAEKVLL